MQSILDRITPGDIRDEPFPYLLTTEALNPDYYQELAAHYPDMSGHPEIGRNNVPISMSGLHAFSDEIPIHLIWRDFMAFHNSADFFRQVVALFGGHIRRCYPDLEERLGKKLEEFTVKPKEMDGDADIDLNVPFRTNTPVSETSRVRCRHVDSTNKLFNAILYFRFPEDDAVGGDLEICRWRSKPLFQDVFVRDDWADVVEVVKYRANTLILFINTRDSVHGVTPRLPTPHIRRYVNFSGELKDPLYDIKPYQNEETPWALTMGNPSPG